VDVGEDTALGNGHVAEKLVQLLVVPDGELKVPGDDTGLLVVAGGVASQLENLGSEVLEHGSEVDGGAGTDTLGVVALAKETVHTTNGERQTGLRRTTTLHVSIGCGRRRGRNAPTSPAPNEAVSASRPRWLGWTQLTFASSWNRWPCRRTCRLQSF